MRIILKSFLQLFKRKDAKAQRALKEDGPWFLCVFASLRLNFFWLIPLYRLSLFFIFGFLLLSSLPLAAEPTLYERQKVLNERLVFLLQSESTPPVLEEIGTTYLLLEEYPLAILYYHRALQFNPYHSSTRKNLNIAEGKLGLLLTSAPFLPSYRTALFLFAIIGTLTLGSCSLAIWRVRFRKASCYLLLLSGLILLYTMGSYYLAPIEGVLLRSTLLYRGPGQQYSIVTEKPVVSGMKVKVVSVEANGQWLKVIAIDGREGYLYYKEMRLI